VNPADRFAAARVARMATVRADGSPRLVPVTFVATVDEIHTPVDHKPKTTTRLRRLDDIARDPRVSVLVDHYEDRWDRLWWVRADGTASLLEPRSEAHREAAAQLADKYDEYRAHPVAGPVIAISVHRWVSWPGRPDGG
jgi:PPOX class probable F420-dependent enzyme